MTKKEARRLVYGTLVQILRRGSIVDSDEPSEIEMFCEIQERIAKKFDGADT